MDEQKLKVGIAPIVMRQVSLHKKPYFSQIIAYKNWSSFENIFLLKAALREYFKFV